MVSGKGSRRILQDLFSPRAGEHPLPIGERAVRLGYATPQDVASCLAEQRTLEEQGVHLQVGQILLRRRLLTVTRLVTLLAEAEEESPAVKTRMIGKYRIRGIIGKGGMGTVYEAEDSALRRTVALKVVEEDLRHPRMTSRFYREATILGRLRHPHIVAIHDVGRVQEPSGAVVHYIAMEYMAGPTLYDVLAEKKRSRTELVALLAQVAEAAGYVQEHGIVHRDIKPSNILLDEQGRAILTDFGLAHSDAASRLTRSIEVLGTPQYMAPEQIEGKTRKIGPATDVYALGVILYEVLTGRLPFRADRPTVVFSAALRDDPPLPRSIDPSIPKDLETICLKAMAKDPERRYSDGKSLAEDLQRFLRGEPISTKSTQHWARLWRRLLKRSAFLWTAAAALVLSLGGTALYIHMDRRAEIRRVHHRLRSAAELEESGRFREALDEYRAVLALDPPNLRAREGADRIDRFLKERAQAKAGARRKLEAGRLSFETATRMWYDPKISLQEMTKHLDQASALAEEARRLDPELEDLVHFAGRIEEIRGRDSEAENLYRESLRLNPDFGPAHASLGMLLLDRLRPDAWMASAEEHEFREIVEEARSEFAHAVRLLHSDEIALLPLLATAMEAVSRSDWLAARKHAEEGIRRCGRGPGGEEFYWILGVSSTSAEERKAALNTALEIHPRHFRSLLALGSLCLILRTECAQAVDYFTQAIELRPSRPMTYLQRAQARIGTGDHAGALQDTDLLIRWSPPQDPYWLSYAYSTRAQARRFPEENLLAIADWGEAIRLQPTSALLYKTRGGHYLLSHEWSLAVRDLTRALELGPAEEVTYTFRATAFAELGRLDPALEDVTRSIALSPSKPHLYDLRARIHRERKNAVAARADYQKALELAPKDWSGRSACEQALRELGE